MILVDSCIYIRWLRERADIFVELGDHLRRGDLATCGVVRAEVLRLKRLEILGLCRVRPIRLAS